MSNPTVRTQHGRGRLARILRRLTATNDELESDELQEVSQRAGATPIGSCSDRQRVRIRGTIEAITINPGSDNRWLEATVKDGSGTVTLLWMGRHMIPGIDAGTPVIVEGLISCVEGRRTIYNPRYELVST